MYTVLYQGFRFAFNGTIAGLDCGKRFAETIDEAISIVRYTEMDRGFYCQIRDDDQNVLYTTP